MTTNTNDGFLQTLATGGETTIDFDFIIYAKADLQVFETDGSGVINELVLNTDYTIATDQLSDPTGGEIVLDLGIYPSGATAGHLFSCRSNASEKRVTDFQQVGDFFAATLNNQLDYQITLLQQHRRDLNQAVRVSRDSAIIDLFLQDSPQDGYGIVWDGTDGLLRNTTASISNLEDAAVTVADNITAVQDAADAVDTAMKFTFAASTVMADPGTGLLRLNNATPASVTAIAIDDTTAQNGNPNISAFVVSWDDSSSTNKGTLRVTKAGTPGTFAIYTITGLTDNSGWSELAVTYVTGNGTFSASDDLYLSFSRTGDLGATGAQIPIIAGGGTVDAITANFAPDLTLTDLTTCIVISTGPNTITNPTFAPDGLTAHTIVKNGGVALVAGDTGAAGYPMLFEYNSGSTRWELMNPCVNSGTGANQLVRMTAAAKLPAVDGSLLTNLPGAAATLLATATASTSSTLDFTGVITTDYTHYFFVIEALLPSTTMTLQLVASSNNGGSWASPNINIQRWAVTLGGTTAPAYTGANTTPVNINSSEATQIHGLINMTDPLSATNPAVVFSGITMRTSADMQEMRAGVVGGIVNAVRFQPSSGNFTSGKIYLYGIKNT